MAKIKSNHTADINLPIVGGVLRAGATRVVDRWDVVKQTDEIKPLLDTNVIEVIADEKPVEQPVKPAHQPKATKPKAETVDEE